MNTPPESGMTKQRRAFGHPPPDGARCLHRDFSLLVASSNKGVFLRSGFISKVRGVRAPPVGVMEKPCRERKLVRGAPHGIRRITAPKRMIGLGHPMGRESMEGYEVVEAGVDRRNFHWTKSNRESYYFTSIFYGVSLEYPNR
ncbi:hypothetical protein EVAR_39267_1 [Eumeta japonica]|uniref:Uncharacterized protein n=1 Tax=Eumeta variegata TaxID=151549 RepID=A0A4C1VX83_EUMVA|nr:hypothetical protein EVAR_39267_1 [Eumeta japonica]